MPEIYLCQKRIQQIQNNLHPLINSVTTNTVCCLGKDKECFTAGGCFCDESCRHFDDCCPDYEYTCADKFKLCLLDENSNNGVDKTKIKPDSNQNLKELQQKLEQEKLNHQKIKDGTYENDKSQNDLAGADNAHHVAPNACCGPRKYNDGEQCCCFNDDNFSGELIDGPCSVNSCQ